MNQNDITSSGTKRMNLIWEVGNAWTYMGMVIAIIAIVFGWLPVLIAFALPVPGMILRAIGIPDTRIRTTRD